MSRMSQGPSPGASEILRLDNQLCFALYAASRAMTARYRPLLEPLGLTYPQYLVLLVLWERRAATIGEIATALGSDYGSMSPLVKRLETAGLLTRQRRADDERVVEVALTDRGAELATAAEQVATEVFCGLDSDVVDLARLKRELEALRADIEGT